MPRTFKPHKDRLVVTIKLLPVVGVIVFLIFRSTTPAFGLLIPSFFTIFQLLRTHYRVTSDGYLIIGYGMQNVEIKIKDITAIAPNKGLSYVSWFHTYALSGDGLVLKYGKDEELIISPEDQGAFVSCLQTANPKLV